MAIAAAQLLYFCAADVRCFKAELKMFAENTFYPLKAFLRK
jgi:hypothetical protein